MKSRRFSETIHCYDATPNQTKMRIKIKYSKKPSKLMRRIYFARADFNRNEKIIQIIFIDQFNHLVSSYRQLESEVASQLCSLEEKDLTISTQLSTISTQATTLLDNELAKQISEFTISSQEQSISELRLTKLQLKENARINFAQFLPDGQFWEPLHLPCQDSLHLGTLPESTHLGGLKTTLSASSSNSIYIPCVRPGLVENAKGDQLHEGEADDMLHEGEVLLFSARGQGGSRSGVSLPHSTPVSSTISSSPVTRHQQIHPKTEKDKVKPAKNALIDIDKTSILHLVKVVEDLSTKYQNPNISLRNTPRKRPSVVPKVFASVWRNSDLLQFTPFIEVPDPTPIIDWTKVKLKPSLPNPEHFPIHSASQDPNFYMDRKSYYGTMSAEFDVGKSPFGTIPGYNTTMGILPVPDQPMGGYIYCLETNVWLLHATTVPTSRVRWGTARRGRQGGTGGRGRR